MKAAVILNRTAGSLVGQSCRDAIATIRSGFAGQGWDVTVQACEGWVLPEALRQAVDGDSDVVVVGGGDGTVATAAGMLMGTGKALGVLPLGTLNLYAKDLKVPLTLPEAVSQLAAGGVRPLDAGTVNDTVFLNHTILGIYPVMVQDR